MSLIKIVQPHQLLDGIETWIPFTDQAIIITHNQRILIVGGRFLASDLEKYAWCLKAGRTGCWLQRSETGTAMTAEGADAMLDVPQIRISAALKRTLAHMAYVLVIQGRSGSEMAKIVIEPSIERVTTTMMLEALNGYSTVFVAMFSTLHKSGLSVYSVLHENVEVVRAENLKDADRVEAGKVKLWC